MIQTHTDDALMAFGWWALGFTLIGFFVTSYYLAYYLGHKRGLGQFRLSNPFGPAPIKERIDPQIVQDYKIAKAGLHNMTMQKVRLEKDYTELLEKHTALIERNKKSASAKRAETRARNKAQGVASDGKA